jgi:UDPglucose 6-dehydrogenase
VRAFDVGVVGAGYVGLITGACLAYIGHRVVLVDVDEERVAGLRRGELPIYEPGLESLLAKCKERLHFSTDLPSVVDKGEVVLISVDTPQGDDGAANLSSVAAVARGIGRALSASREKRTHPLVVVNKSTVPAGSGDYVSMLIGRAPQRLRMTA